MKTIEKQLNTDSDIKQKAFHFALKIFIIVLLLGAIVAGIWLTLRNYNGNILPRVTVANQKVGGLEPNVAKKVLDDYVAKINTGGPIIVYQDQAFTPTLYELGVTFDTQLAVDQAYQFGREASLVKKIKNTISLLVFGQNFSLDQEIDEAKMDDYLSQIATVVEINPVDATLKYKNGAWALEESSDGLGLNKNRLKGSLDNLIQTGKNQNEIALEMTLLEPKVKNDGALAAQEQANQFLAAAPIKIEFKDENLKFEASRDEVASWIEFVAIGNLLKPDVSAKKLGSYIDWMASKIEIDKIDKEVVDGTNEVRTEGKDGRSIDKISLASEIKSRVNSGTAGETIQIVGHVVPFETTVIYPSAQPGRYTGRYIDVNLTEQKLYAFEGTKLVNSFLVSTGRPGYATPTGEFAVYGKNRVTRMDGPGYDLPNVQWVSWWSGDYSVHGTYWHSNFGHVMSHGCVNASNADAEWLYNWDDIGTPVYIHY